MLLMEPLTLSILVILKKTAFCRILSANSREKKVLLPPKSSKQNSLFKDYQN